MSKFEAKSIACENGWEETLGLSLFNARYLIEISCLEVQSLGAQAIGKLLGVCPQMRGC